MIDITVSGLATSRAKGRLGSARRQKSLTSEPPVSQVRGSLVRLLEYLSPELAIGPYNPTSPGLSKAQRRQQSQRQQQHMKPITRDANETHDANNNAMPAITCDAANNMLREQSRDANNTRCQQSLSCQQNTWCQ